jgi:hypothetical protein
LPARRPLGAVLEIVLEDRDLAGFGLFLFKRLNDAVQQNVKVSGRTELFQ